MITVQEAIERIEACGEEMRRPSTIPLWAQHEANAKLCGNPPAWHMIGSLEWSAWRDHQIHLKMKSLPRATILTAEQRREQEAKWEAQRKQNTVGAGFLPADSVMAGKAEYEAQNGRTGSY